MKSEGCTTQLSHPLFVSFSGCNRYVAFVELIHLNDLNDNETFIFLTNQWRRHRHTTHTQHTHNNLLLVGHTLRAGACKNTNKVPFKILNRNCSQIEFDTLIPWMFLMQVMLVKITQPQDEIILVIFKKNPVVISFQWFALINN